MQRTLGREAAGAELKVRLAHTSRSGRLSNLEGPPTPATSCTPNIVDTGEYLEWNYPPKA
jgi:hypothetical protein